MNVKVGDRIRQTTIGEVTGLSHGGMFAYLDNGGLALPTPCHASIEKLPPHKAKAGDVITGQRLCETMWKRGTIVRFAIDADRREPCVLHGDGNWYSLDVIGRSVIFDLDHIHKDELVEVVYVA